MHILCEYCVNTVCTEYQTRVIRWLLGLGCSGWSSTVSSDTVTQHAPFTDTLKVSQRTEMSSSRLAQQTISHGNREMSDWEAGSEKVKPKPLWMKDNRFLQYDCDSTTVSHLNELFKPPNPHFTFGSKAEQRHVLEPFSSSQPVSKWNALIKSKQLQCTDLTLVLTRAQTSHWVDGLCVRTGSGNERLFLCGNMLPSVVEFNRPSDYCCLLHWQINPVNNNNNSLSLLILQIPVSRSSTSSTRSLSFPGTNSVFFFSN